ncbi:MAG: phosphoribosylanthranilate isomerase [Lewinella sp.]|nr:phosphoribosylanthranilate isomerase [Lewinella sp.]
MSQPRVKICCISSLSEARLAIAHGAAALGLVGPMPSGPGVIDDALIQRIAADVPAGIDTFLLTSETHPQAIMDHHARTRTTTIQLVDALPAGAHQRLRAALPGVQLVQVIHVINEESVAEALSLADAVDALLLDSGNPMLAVKELGGTGRTHDWRLSRRIVEQSPVPVFLAGGLNPANVRQAIDTVQPYGLDLCSGVRTNGKLDQEKLAAFFRAIQ